MSPTATRTASGRSLDLLKPDPRDVDIRDIAHHLSQINRYGGASCFPVNVAQHSVLALSIGMQILHQPRATQIYTLLHDAHEAYLGDITSPAAVAIDGPIGDTIDTLKDGIDDALWCHFGLESPDAATRALVRKADRMAFATEWRDTMHGPCPVADEPAPWPVEFEHFSASEGRFMAEFKSLMMAVA